MQWLAHFTWHSRLSRARSHHLALSSFLARSYPTALSADRGSLAFLGTLTDFGSLVSCGTLIATRLARVSWRAQHIRLAQSSLVMVAVRCRTLSASNQRTASSKVALMAMRRSSNWIC